MNDRRTNFTSNKPRRVVPAAMIGAFVLGSGAFAGTMHVPGDYATIQAAINASSDGDEIVLDDGTYTGAGNRNLTPGGRAITIRSANGPDACTIDAAGGAAAFDLTAVDGDGVLIEGITLTNDGFGRGLRCIGASPTIRNCTFASISYGEEFAIDGGAAVYQNGGSTNFIDCTFFGNNVSACFGISGGAMSVSNGSLSLRECRFESNEAHGTSCVGGGSGSGGAIRASNSTLTIERTDFVANVARGSGNEGPAGSGGAMSLSGCNGTIVDCTFTGNRASAGGEGYGGGGAISLGDSGMVVRDCIFDDNAASSLFAEGGAVRGFSGTDTFVNCSFTNNVATAGVGAEGGAIWLAGASNDTTIINCRFESNEAACSTNCYPSASLDGGGVALMEGASSLINCLFAGNDAERGSALYAAGDAEMINCTIANNVDPVGDGPVHTSAGGSTTVRNSIIRSMQPNAIVGSGVVDMAYSNVTSGGATGTGNIDLDPLFANAANGDYRLATGSPSIDAGSSADLPADELDLDDDGNVKEPLPVDLDDAVRVVGPEVDMGAYETDDSCDADLDGDDSVGFGDLTMLLASWGKCVGCQEDLDGDGSVGFSDLTALLVAWGPCV